MRELRADHTDLMFPNRASREYMAKKTRPLATKIGDFLVGVAQLEPVLVQVEPGFDPAWLDRLKLKCDQPRSNIVALWLQLQTATLHPGLFVPHSVRALWIFGRGIYSGEGGVNNVG